MLRVRIVGVREFLAAFGAIDYELRTTDDSVEGQITEDGQLLELPLSSVVRRAELVLMRNTTFELAIGGLGPVQESRGALDRLDALGYVAEVVAEEFDDDDVQQASDPLATALRAFQRDHDLPVTGELDDATQRALADEYGT